MNIIPESSRVPLFYRINLRTPLRFGMRGDDVKELQFWLDNLNDFYKFNKRRVHSSRSIKQTGQFDTITMEMVIELQSFWNYPTTGVVDMKTLDLIEWKRMNMDEVTEKQYTALKWKGKNPHQTRKW